MQTPRRRTEVVKRLNGETFLGELKSIEIKLESGKIVTFDIASELAIPRDPDEMREAAMNAHSRLAFWAYQEQRALQIVRQQEKTLDEVEAHAHLIWRKYYDDLSTEFATNDMIKSRLALEPTVQSARIRLQSFKHQYGVIRALKESLEHRCHLLRKTAIESTNRA
jgi:hypothetical protein